MSTLDGNWADQFVISCKDWQGRLGLTDWTLAFKTAGKDGNHEAAVDYNCKNRQATLTSYLGAEEPASPYRVALHEMLHLLLADYSATVAARASDTHRDAAREEHRVIERLLNAMDGRL